MSYKLLNCVITRMHMMINEFKPNLVLIDEILLLDAGSKNLQCSNISQTIYSGSLLFELYLRLTLNMWKLLDQFYYSQNVLSQCLHVKSKLFRALFRKHDFVVYMRSLQNISVFENGSILLVAFFLYHIFAFNIILNYGSRLRSNFTWKVTMSGMDVQCIGGGQKNMFSLNELLSDPQDSQLNVLFKFHDYVLEDEVLSMNLNQDSFVTMEVSFKKLISKLSISALRVIAEKHGVFIHSKMSRSGIEFSLSNHICFSCSNFVSIFEKIDLDVKENKRRLSNLMAVKKYQEKHGENFKNKNLVAVQKSLQKKAFPPEPPSLELQHTIISGFCKETSPSEFSESACCVCGKLTSIYCLKSISDLNISLNILKATGVTQKERFSDHDPICDLDGPVMLQNLDNVCKTCHESVLKGKQPLLALANGLWLGNIPDQLSNLTYAEQLLIARVRHNRCIVRVSSGMHKMRANAIVFANPTPKIYNVLPPPLDELDQVLAFIYTGPCKPTKSDFEKTPLLVRRNNVAAALNWLKLNHADYYDVEISQVNLNEYPEHDIPVVIDYRHSLTNKNPESTAVHDDNEEDGTESGSCPFVVHGLTGEEYSTKSIKTIKAIALKHLTSGGKILAIGHAKEPESIYRNPQLFPQMMPWLFPYGLGGIGNPKIKGRLSEEKHKKYLLMYHDKRFPKDPHFPLVSFNHEQIKQSSTGGYLLAETSKFEPISQRLMDLDTVVLNDIARRMENGEHVKPETDQEKQCFQLIKDLDHVGGHIKGSLTNKKYMRNEIWSLISFAGAPSWFITFSPADNMHPISLYYADSKETFTPEIRSSDERYKLIAENPVAGARFFHFVCEMFIKHVLGVDANHPGFYGKTNAYYGVVEQQGRLTLHLHMLLWLYGCLTPQEIRDKILDSNSDFQTKLVQYLESVHIGEFLTGSMDEVKSKVDQSSKSDTYKVPTQTLPESPPPLCNAIHDNCDNCMKLDTWWDKFKTTVDDLILHSNVHNCGRYSSSKEKVNKKDRPSCMNKDGKCKARFPRPTFDKTQVDPHSGALNIRKGEPWINTLTPLVTYLLRCNSDITSLLSGTAIKAVVAYVSEYITKPGLKTYVIFDIIRSL